jgi:hypothetical protein
LKRQALNAQPAFTTYRGRRSRTIENDTIRVTVLCEGGHIAEILHKPSGINPLWTPPWSGIEPSAYDAAKHPEYGSGIDARLLAGIMGHNVCLDIFGGPSEEEVTAGIGVHGEGAVAAYDVRETDGALTMSACLPLAQIRFERVITLREAIVEVRESIESLAAFDRPIGWTQHVTLGPPFLECGVTRFKMPATKSKVFQSEFGPAGYLKCGAEFEWPMAPRNGGGGADLSIFNSAAVSSAYTAHLMDSSHDRAYFSARHPGLNLSFGYSWARRDFPWLGRWEENRSRTHAPWNGVAITCGLEFGVSPFPETRRQMIDRGSLFGESTYRWLPARAKLEVEYTAGFGV